MFLHLFKMKLKILLRNKLMLFWTLIFPFVLGTFFHLAFSNIGETYELENIKIAVVNDSAYEKNEVFKSVITSLSKGENRLFDTTYVDMNKAKELLLKDEIKGYIIFNEENPELVIKENGVSQTIIKYALDEYYEMKNVASFMITSYPEKVMEGTLQILKEDKQYLKDNSKEKIDFSLNYFLTLIAMACLYGSLIGLEVVKDSEANLSCKGARVCISPVSKMKIILSGILAGYVIQLVALFFLFVYLKCALSVNFGTLILPTIILSMVGSLAGISLGTFIGVSNKKKEGFKTGLLISVIMVFCFFSGMMGPPQMKNYFDETIPMFQKINPVHMITDGLYSIYAYDTLDVYYHCLIDISIFTIIMIGLTFIFIRRKNYDSI